MKTIFFVQSDEAEKARRIEKILLSLPEDSGIMFVGVSVISDPLSNSRKSMYQVVVGCDRAKDTKLIEFLVRTYLREEIKDDSQLTIYSYRGIVRQSFGS